MTSRAILNYASHGMHLTTFEAREFQDVEGNCYRVELYTEGRGNEVKAASYRRERHHWLPYINPLLGRMRREMITSLDREMKEAA